MTRGELGTPDAGRNAASRFAQDVGSNPTPSAIRGPAPPVGYLVLSCLPIELGITTYSLNLSCKPLSHLLFVRFQVYGQKLQRARISQHHPEVRAV